MEILVDDSARNVLSRFDTVGLVHRKVTELVGAQHIIGLETGIEPLFSPYPAQSAGIIDDDDLCRGV